jgi:hypothetical protein
MLLPVCNKSCENERNNARNLLSAVVLTLPRELKLKIGNPVELRLGAEVVLRTKIVGIEHCDAWSPKHTFGFLLPRNLSKANVQIGAEVWTLK